MTILTPRKSTPPEFSREALRRVCQEDLWYLARRILYADVETPMTEDFHREVVRWRQRSPFARNLILLARDHLKTSLLTVAGNVQRILRNPQVRILLASNKAEAAEAQLSEIKGHLTNPYLIWLFPETLHANPDKEADRWSGGSITVKRKRRTKEATIETIGCEGAATGKHYDHGSFDDLVDEQNSLTKDLLQKVIYWYQTTQSLFEPKATQEIVGTPWAFGDLYDWLLEQKLKRHFKLGVYRQPCYSVQEPGVLRIGARGEILEDNFVFDAEGHRIPVYPSKHSRSALEERAGINSRIFAAQWLLRPVDDETALFPRSGAVIRPRHTFPDQMWPVMAVDPAISTREWADYSAIVVMGFGSDGNAYVLDIRRGRWQESELIDNVYTSYAANPGIKVIGFEAVGFQKLYLREFARVGQDRGYLPIMKLERDNRVGKSIRIRALEPLWKSKQLIIADDIKDLPDFLEEAERFRPWREALHDDMLDAMADCLQLRIRPEAVDPNVDLDDEEAERRRFEDANPALRNDKTSMRNAWGMHRRRKLWQEERDRDEMGLVEADEFHGV